MSPQVYIAITLFFLQEEKANVEKKLRALRSDVDDRDTTITLLTEELNDTRAAVEALEEELTEWRSKQVGLSFAHPLLKTIFDCVL